VALLRINGGAPKMKNRHKYLFFIVYFLARFVLPIYPCIFKNPVVRARSWWKNRQSAKPTAQKTQKTVRQEGGN
jgi:hypothetical protein